MVRAIIALAVLLACPLTLADIRITTWNIEHLGSTGRGFGGGFGSGSLPLRTDAQLNEISEFIRDTLRSDVIAVQEVAKTGPNHTSLELDRITAHMGANWEYFIADAPAVADMVNGFIWNTDTVTALGQFTIDMPNIELAGKNLFNRMPVGLYLEINEPGQTDRTDIVLINVHMASGQGNDENHAIAIIAIEHALTSTLTDNQITESDRIILGDFNDNPFALTSAGNPAHIQTLYQHMARKRYVDMVPASMKFTRMNDNLTSLVDHILANSSARNDILESEADRFTPGAPTTFATWRGTFSDHFPLSFTLESKTDFDVDFTP